MRIEIKSDVTLRVEASAEVSADENASALIVTIRVRDGNGWKDLNITSALSDNDKALLLIAIEDKHRQNQDDRQNFGTDEAG